VKQPSGTASSVKPPREIAEPTATHVTHEDVNERAEDAVEAGPVAVLMPSVPSPIDDGWADADDGDDDASAIV
jgi:hypothetical protein